MAENMEYAQLKDDQLDKLISAEKAITAETGKEVILLAYQKS
ncbi:MAG: hypothetical protein M0Z31_15865 [Clostridia bacterium]|nr:hypothetical protein [Clostridia bacterium]